MIPSTQTSPQLVQAEQTFLRRVYNWMTAGLVVSGLVSLYLMNNEALIVKILSNPVAYWGLFIGQIVVAFWLILRIQKLSSGAAIGLFLLYSVLSGLALSPIFLLYTKSSIASVFFIAAGTFAGASFYGYVAKGSLSTVGGYARMGLIGVIIASVINWFIQSPGFDLVISYIAVAVIIALTAYDTQRLKQMSRSNFGNDSAATNVAVIGAFGLYLNFVILFVHLLRILGDRR